MHLYKNMLYHLRAFKDRALGPVADHLAGVSPNTVTMLSVIPGILAGVLWWMGAKWALWTASAMVVLNGVLDTLDGVMARRSGRTSALGDYLDCVADRYTDMAIIVGMGLSPFASLSLGLGAALSVLLVSFFGTQAEASGGVRVESGILGRPERHFLLIIVPILQIFAPRMGPLTPTEWILWIFVVLGNITALWRVWKGVRAIADKETSHE